MLRNLAITALVVTLVSSALAQALPRTNTSQKGSVLIFPDVRVVQTAGANPKTVVDTFLQLSNDFDTQGVHVLIYFVCGRNCGRLVNNADLTKSQPVFWRASTGQPYGVSPITKAVGCAWQRPGYVVYEGYYLVFAATEDRQQIRWNHLSGLATIVDYENGCAEEYAPYAFQALTGSNGDPVGTAGTINLDSTDYDSGYNRLLLEFISSGSSAFSGGGQTITHDTRLTLMINDIDLRQEPNFYYTKAYFDIWNQDEVSFAAEYCIDCWDATYLGELPGEPFSYSTLGFSRARAAIDGIPSPFVCDTKQIITAEHALLGVASKILDFKDWVCETSETLVGTGNQSAVINFDPKKGPEEGAEPPAVEGSAGSDL